MRILHVSERVWPMGGAERMLHDTCAALAQAGHEVSALVAEDTPGGSFSWPLAHLPRSRGPRVAARVRPLLDGLLDRVRPDVIHVHNAQDFLSPFLVAHLHRRAPTLRYVHDARLVCPRVPSKRLRRDDRLCPHAMGLRCLAHCFPVDCGGGHKRALKELTLLFGDLAVTRRLPAVAVGSEYMRALMLQNGIAPSRLHLLPGFTGMAPQGLPLPAAPHVLAIGRFDGAKGLEDLPALLSGLRTPHWRATIVGAGMGLAATGQRAAALGLADRVRFVGHLERAGLEALYAQASVVIMPTRLPEAFGLVGIEALANGRPVVAFDLGGVGEWLHDGETGYRVAPDDVAAFTARLDTLLSDTQLAFGLGQAGRRLVEQRFRPEHHMRPLLRLYAQLAATESSS